MSDKTKQMGAAFLATLVAVVLLTIIVFLVVSAAVPALPMPVESFAASQNSKPRLVTINAGTIATTSTFIGGYGWAEGGHSLADVYYSIDQGTTNNITLTLQVSPDNVTWVSHGASSAILSNSAVDVTGYSGGINIQLQYFRILATTLNSETITPTIKVYLR